MKKILIATRNKDKFKIVSNLLKSVFKNYTFKSLDDIEDIINDKAENGDLINRSYRKAKNAFDEIKYNDYEYIIGVDDGIEINGKIIENVKDYIKPIIDNKILKENEVVYIIRSYTFINKEGIKYSILTKIPFKYKRINYKLEIKKGTYPLSHVLTPLDLDTVVADMDSNETNKYYTLYSKIKFIETKNYFNNN